MQRPAPANLRELARMTVHRVIDGGDLWIRPDDSPETIFLKHSAVINGAEPKYVWTTDGEARWCDLGKLVDRLAKDHVIGDRIGLENAIDTAVRIFHDGPGTLRKADVEQLMAHVHAMTELLSEENQRSITAALTNRDDSLIYGGAWNYEHACNIRMNLGQIRKGLSVLEHDLKLIPPRLPQTRKPDLRLQAMLGHLECYWESLGRKVARTFTPKDPKTKRQLAASEAMRFVEAVVEFIEPDALPKLPSAVRHRRKRKLTNPGRNPRGIWPEV